MIQLLQGNLKNKINKLTKGRNKQINTESKLISAKGVVGRGMGKMAKEEQEVHTCKKEVNTSWHTKL